MNKRRSAKCPISYRCPLDDDDRKSKLLEYIYPGYETCKAPDLSDASTQTDAQLLFGEDSDEIMERYLSHMSNVSNADMENFTDVIESGEDEFFSVGDEKPEETYPAQSIFIQLKDSPHIILDDGLQKTKISLTSKYLSENGLELAIESENKNIKLRTGKKQIYPSVKFLPPEVVITELFDEDWGESFQSNSSKIVKDEEDDESENCRKKKKIGVVNLVLDHVEDSWKYEEVMKEQLQNENRESDMSKFLPNWYGDKSSYSKKKRNLIEEISKELGYEIKKKDKIIPKTIRGKGDDSKIDDFVPIECDPLIDLIKEPELEQLQAQYFEPQERLTKDADIQTEVHINPNTSEDYTFTDESDMMLLQRFNVLRGKGSNPSTRSSLGKQSQTTDHDITENLLTKTNTYEATTIGQKESDISIKSEPTMEGIPELTEKINFVEIPHNEDLLNKKEFDLTEKDGPEISGKKVGENPSTSIENRTKETDTSGLDQESKTDEVTKVTRPFTSPSLLKAFQSFEEELSPLKSQLSKLHSEFKSIEIPEDLKRSLSTGIMPHLSPLEPYLDPYSTPTDSYQALYKPLSQQFRRYEPEGRMKPRGLPCHCPPGSCLGLRRSSGVECQRIRRLSSQASSSEFLRAFTEPAWLRNNVYQQDSIWSEPEDILGISPPPPPSSRNNDKINKTNKF